MAEPIISDLAHRTRISLSINKELTMNTIFLFVIGIAALSGLLAVMFYLLAVSREMELPDEDEV